MKPDLQRTLLSFARDVLQAVRAVIVVGASGGTAYLSGYLLDELGFGLWAVVAAAMIGFCAGFFAGAAAYRWLEIRLTPPPLHPAEVFNKAGSR